MSEAMHKPFSLRTAPKPTQLLALAFCLATASLYSEPAFAKQCIYNKAGFVLSVTWIKPSKEVYKTENLSYGQSSCSPDEAKDYIAALSIVGGKLANSVTQGTINTLLNVLNTATADAAEDDIKKIKEEIDASLPEKDGLFWSGIPSTDKKYLDVWGTIWSPQTGPGGNI
jgi:hypothetical protein